MTHTFYLGVRAHDFEGETLDALFAGIARLGIEAIQFAPRITLSALPWEKGVVTPGLGQFIKQALDRHGLRVSVLGCYIHPSAQDTAVLQKNIELFRQNLLLAKYIGAGMVAMETGAWETPELTAGEAAYQTLLSTVRQLIVTAERLGVSIGIEPVATHVIHSSEMAQRLFEDVGSDNLTLVFDPMNAIGSEMERQHDIIDGYFDMLGRQISVIHLKDRKSVGKTLLPCHAGEGSFDFQYLFDRTKACKPVIDMILEETGKERFAGEKKRLQMLGL